MINEDKRSLIIDTDPGIDDAIALAIALFEKSLDVKLITTVAGNVNLEYVTENTLKLLKFYQKKIPVAKGMSKPLIRKSADAKNVHGKTGLEGYEFEDGDASLLLEENAINAMYETIMKNSTRTTILAIGPLTNVAMLITMYPETIDKIEEIVLMGGSLSRGNYGVYSEFNIGYDPEAAKIIFDSNIKRTVVGMDIGQKALIMPEISEKIRNMNKIGDMFYSLFKKYRGGSFNTGLKMYDSTAIAYLLKPDMFIVEETFVDIELTGNYSYGASVIDLKGYLNKEANSVVCTDIDTAMFTEWFLECISHMGMN